MFAHLPDPAAADRLLSLLRTSEVDSAGFFAATDEIGRVLAAVLAVAQPGAQGQLLPPHATEETVSDRLLAHANDWLESLGAKVVQVNLPEEDRHCGDALVRAGFWRVTRLLHFARETAGRGASADTVVRLLPYADVDPAVFAETLIASYEGSLDCPELDGVRTAEEVIDGYRGPAGPSPAWFLSADDDDPTGVLLLAPGDAADELELAYLGVVPAARGRKLGSALARAAVRIAADRGAARLTTGVDERNHPAIRMYDGEGFALTGRSVAYLRISAGQKNLDAVDNP
jgi:ribosomal protein S18 acetylase RimI-like enzyme